MKSREGFTFTDAVIAVAIIAILTIVTIPAYQDCNKRHFYPNGQPKSETVIANEAAAVARESTKEESRDTVRCIAGYKFTQTGVQIISSTNGGVPCL